MLSSIPQLQSDDRVVSQIQQNIVQPLNALLKNPLTQGTFLTNISISSGANVIPHGLGRTAQGWVVTDVTANIDLYRSADFNAQNLTLTSSGSGNVNLYVF